MANSTVNKSNGFQSPRRMLAAAAMSTLASSAASAAPIYWGAAGVTNLWATSSNWYTDAAETAVSGSVPVSTSDVYFNTTPDNALGGTITVGTDIFANSLTFNTSATTTLSQSGNRVLSLGTGGITANSGAATIGVSTNSLSVQLTGSQTWTNNSSNTLNVRTFRASNSATGPVELTLNAAGAGAITFNLSAQDSPDATKALSIVIDSAGANSVNMVASGYTGGTTVKRGFLNTSGTLGTGSIALGLAGGTNDLRLNATGAVANNITVASGTGLRALTGSGSGDFQGNITLNRDVSIGSVSSSGQTLAVSGNISGNASITVGRIAGGTSNPTVTLTGDSTFTGKTIVESAVLVVDSLNSVSGGSSSSALGAPTTVANGTISLSAVSSSTLRYIGTGETTDRVIDMAGATNGVTLEQAGTGHLKFTSNLTSTGNGAKTLTLRGATAGTAEISGNIPNSTGSIALNKSDSGTWRLSGEGSTYAGITTVAGGVLEIIKIANINSPSSIGAPTIAVGPTVLNGGGTLRYIGAGDSTNRVLRWFSPTRPAQRSAHLITPRHSPSPERASTTTHTLPTRRTTEPER
jgi:autotransporter-associated beta strand protein